jgi:tRNA G18 (ribose-2'-O)-methylase SpoU
VVEVHDPADGRLDDYRSLNDQPWRRRLEAERGLVVVEGVLAVEQLLASGLPARSLLVSRERAHAVVHVVEAMSRRGVPVLVAGRAVVAAAVGFDLHRGVVAVAERPPARAAGELLAGATARPPAGRPLVLVVEGVNDGENLGALLRTAAAFGVAAVLLDPTTADPWSRRAVRVSLGHALGVPVARMVPWPGGMAEVRAAGFVVVALAPHPADGAPGPPACTVGELGRHLPVGRGAAVLVGAEGPGLSAAALGSADVVARVPMAAGVDSLNVATAAAVALHRLSADG